MEELNEWKESEISEIQQMVKRLADPNKKTASILFYITGRYKYAGLGELLSSGDITKAKQYFYYSGRVGMIEFEADQDQLPIPGKLIQEYVTNGIRSWPIVLLSDSPQLWHDFAQIIPPTFPNAERAGDFGSQISLALKYLLLDDASQARHWAQMAQQAKGRPKELAGYGTALLGLLNQDVQQINQGIQQHLSWYKHNANNKHSVDYAIDKDATALSLLAVRRGFAVDLSDRFIHQGLIEHTEPVDIDQQEIDAVYAALAKALNPRANLWDSLKRLFKR